MRYVTILTALAIVLISSEPVLADGCTTELECDTTNSHGALLVGTNDIVYHDGTNCLDSWDCQYADGFQTRHYGEPIGGTPE